MKKARKKLTLHRETITNLNANRLGEVGGGGPKTNGTICNSICLTLCNCPSQNTQCNTGCLPCGTQTDCIGTAAC